MAKTEPANTKPAGTATPAVATAKRADRKTRELAGLLRNISDKYRDASVAIAKGNNADYEDAMELATTYQDLFAQLSRKVSDTITADGLAAVQGS